MRKREAQQKDHKWRILRQLIAETIETTRADEMSGSYTPKECEIARLTHRLQMLRLENHIRTMREELEP